MPGGDEAPCTSNETRPSDTAPNHTRNTLPESSTAAATMATTPHAAQSARNVSRGSRSRSVVAAASVRAACARRRRLRETTPATAATTPQTMVPTPGAGAPWCETSATETRKPLARERVAGPPHTKMKRNATHRIAAELSRLAPTSTATWMRTEHSSSIAALPNSTWRQSTPRSATHRSWNGSDPATSAAAKTSPACILPSTTVAGFSAVESVSETFPFGTSSTSRAKTMNGTAMHTPSPVTPESAPSVICPTSTESPPSNRRTAIGTSADARSCRNSSRHSPPVTRRERVNWRSSLTRKGFIEG